MRVYAAHRLRGADREETLLNINRAIEIGRWIIKQGHMPLVPHVFALIFDDHNPPERDQGISLGNEMLKTANELWAFGEISPGVRHEIDLASRLGIPVRYFEHHEGAPRPAQGVPQQGLIKCGLCGKWVDVAATMFCRRHRRVCFRCWNHEYSACQVCADREYAEEVRYV